MSLQSIQKGVVGGTILECTSCYGFDPVTVTMLGVSNKSTVVKLLVSTHTHMFAYIHGQKM